MRSSKWVLAILCCLVFGSAVAQPVNPELLHAPWQAQWITWPGAGLKAYEVFHFRKRVVLTGSVDRYIVHITADSRYKFFVNGRLVGLGPARSDLLHWNFDTYDLAAYFRTGVNQLAVLVWNQGEWNAYAQHSYRTALLVQGDGAGEAAVNTDTSWTVYKDSAYAPVIFRHSDPRLFWQYYVAGALDSVAGARYPWGWKEATYDDAAWEKASGLVPGCPDGCVNPGQWNLRPRSVGYLDRQPGRLATVVRVSTGPESGDADSDLTPRAARLIAGKQPMAIPPHARVEILLDNALEITAYPELLVSGGKDSRIKISYAEALLQTEKDHPYRWHKGNRNETAGKKLYGVYDVFNPDGGERRSFIPLWMRVFRFIRLDIETGDDSLRLDDLAYHTVMYPFVCEGRFSSDQPVHGAIDSACLRTIRLASQETYIDPYYEQMQYVGDTRLQALYGYYHFADDRLTRNAIEQFSWSQNADGLTMSRYPSDLPQYSPLFSLCWCLMVRDYWQLRPDSAYPRRFIPQMVAVLDWFVRHINEKGILGDLPYLDFLDTDYPRDRILAASRDKSLTPYALFFVYTVQQLKPLFAYYHQQAAFKADEESAEQVRRQVVAHCFDPSRGEFADNADKRFFSQHANIMAVLTDCVTGPAKRALMQKVLSDTSLLPVSMYFDFYKFAAMRSAGMGAGILHQLGPWDQMLANNQHTFSEWLVDPRSECHAWSAYPAYYFLNTIAGIGPGAPGFRRVVIEPHPGELHEITATVPHPAGPIDVHYKFAGGHWSAAVRLPGGVGGVFRWKGRDYVLASGSSVELSLP